MYNNEDRYRRKRRPRRRVKRRRINKARFAVFSFTVILFLSIIFIKFFLPSLSKSPVAEAENQNGSPEWIEKKEDMEKEILRNRENKNILTDSDSKETDDKSAENSVDDDKEDKEDKDKADQKKDKFDFKMDSAAGPLIYYNQEDPKWSDQLYGPSDPIGTHGCGPTVMASVVSSLTEYDMDPVQMSNWAYENGYCAVGNGSLHSLIPDAARAFGLNVEPLYHANEDSIKNALSEGKIIVELSGHGIFSDEDGHFFIIRELKPNGKVTVSDSVNLSHVFEQWNIQTLINEASNTSSSGGPFWAIGK